MVRTFAVLRTLSKEYSFFGGNRFGYSRPLLHPLRCNKNANTEEFALENIYFSLARV